jgi:nucleotide-binding universal stress UspA family protein
MYNLSFISDFYFNLSILLFAHAQMKGRIRKGKGKPGEAIIKAANDEGACMIVCGTRGHGKLKRAFLGSVSDYVAHHSTVPVIICRRH